MSRAEGTLSGRGFVPFAPAPPIGLGLALVLERARVLLTFDDLRRIVGILGLVGGLDGIDLGRLAAGVLFGGPHRIGVVAARCGSDFSPSCRVRPVMAQLLDCNS